MNNSASKTIVLSREDVQEIVRKYELDVLMDNLIERLEDAIKVFNPMHTIIPVRSGFNYTEPNTGLIEWMPLYSKENEVTIKLVGYHPTNPDKYNLPTILSTVSNYDTTTGHLLGIMDGVLLTALRTGAASAIASKYLADPESSTLGLIGCGVQAITQLHAISRVFEIEKVLIHDANHETLTSFQERCSALNLSVEIIPSTIEEIIMESDIVSTATSIEVNQGPLFNSLETKPHLHINAVGSDFPGKIELPLDFLDRSFICPDFKEQAVVEGECQQLEPDQINAELYEVIQKIDDFDFVKKGLSVFDSTGWPLEDKVAMDLFLECAHELNLGQQIDIEIISKDAKNPYDFINEDLLNLTVDFNK